MSTRVRFAPSPTGILHVGGIRTAIFNYFFAKNTDGSFILRNEDTDQARKVEGSLDATLESLRWLGIEWDELVTQSERLDEYKKYADQLLSNGRAREEEGAVRFNVEKLGTTTWIDSVGNKEVTFQNADVEDFIILKKDGFPTYHFANVVDDHLMNITHVIRGEDWIPSTPKHLMLYKAFGWQPPIFAHVPNVMGTDGKKLSKRRGAKSVLDFRNEGCLPEALLNYLMLLGWSPKNDREILTKEEIVTEFSLEKINSASAIFDERKLQWMNGIYIREKIPNDELIERVREFDPELFSVIPEDVDMPYLFEVSKTRVKDLRDFRTLITPFFQKKDRELDYELKPLQKELLDILSKISEWTMENLTDVIINKVVKDKGIKYKSLYEIVIGSGSGLPLNEAFAIIGRTRTLELLR